MAELKVYLAGPITGCSFEGCTDWRKEFEQFLREYGVEGLSPMRGKEYLSGSGPIEDSYADKVLSCSRGIMTRDFFDCTRCDLVFVNFLGAQKVSIGTAMEVAWAFHSKIPVVVAIEDEGNPHEHSMIREAIGFRVNNLDAARDVILHVLNRKEPVGVYINP